MAEHKKYSFKEFRNMTKDDKMRCLVDELNAMSEDMYEEKKTTFFGFYDEPHHFYLQKEFGFNQYYILRNDNDNKVECVAFFGENESKMLNGCAELSSEQQRMLMQFFIAFN